MFKSYFDEVITGSIFLIYQLFDTSLYCVNKVCLKICLIKKNNIYFKKV